MLAAAYAHKGQLDDAAISWLEFLFPTLESTPPDRNSTCAILHSRFCNSASLNSREVVRHIGQSLVIAMNKAKQGGDSAAAGLVACECVVFAETKDHLNWELLSKCAEVAEGKVAWALTAAVGQVEEQEDEHLYRSKGWCRELWIQALGMEAVLPHRKNRRT